MENIWVMMWEMMGGGDKNDDGKNGGANLASCLVSTVLRVI